MAVKTEIVWRGAESLRQFLVPIDSLEPWPGNPRRGDIPAVRASLHRFGQVKPIVIDGSRIVAGHHLVRAAQEEGWTHVAAAANEFGSEDEQRAYLLADNRTSDLGEYDLTDLLAQLDAAQAVGLEGTGYTDDSLVDLQRQLQKLADVETFARAADPAAADPDEVPPLPESPDSKLGEVYELGPHRLLCGDARDNEQMATLMNGETAGLLWTDPPYGVNYQGDDPESLRRRNRRVDGNATVANDALGEEGTRALLIASLSVALHHLKRGGPFYICAPSGPSEITFRLALLDLGLELRQVIVWAKDVFAFGRQDYHWRHESILYGWASGAAHEWFGGRTQDTVWQIPRPKRSPDHPTTKPVELVARAIRNSSADGAVVLDPFGGSGSTLVAADALGRRAFLAEIDPRYCDVIRKRYEAFAALPPEQRLIAWPQRELTLQLDESEFASLTQVHLEILAKELGTSGHSETVLAACARLARDLNQAA